MSTGPHSRAAAEAAIPATVFDEASYTVARNYAEALVNVAAKDGQVDAVLDELDEFVADMFGPDRPYARVLVAPTIPTADKDRILVQAFQGQASSILMRFLRVLNGHGRLALLPQVARSARDLWDRRQNRVHVTVRSAAPLDEAQQGTLRDRLGRMIAATPVVHWQVDPDLIGGLVVQVGDQVYDASIRNGLRQLRRRLVEDKVYELQARREAFSSP
jgi:F-type H+-transporting ATPase subunit delta